MAFVVPDWRGPDERYGLYVIRTGVLQLIATCSSPEAVGVALCLLASEGEFEGTEGFGVLDSHGEPAPGEWLVNPFNSRRIVAI